MYCLLNKDELIAKFDIDQLLESVVNVIEFKRLPNMFGDIRVFIKNRRAPKHRENIKKLLELSGCDTLRGFLDVAHALSLVDTFWVKQEGSKLRWEDVSLYTHPFDEAIAKTAFEGGLHGIGFSTTSPEYGTDGSFAKCWIREGQQIKMLKRGSSGASNAGLEPYSEYYASQVVKLFTDNYVYYGLRSKSGRICSVCNIFTSEDYGYVPYAAVDSGNTSIDLILENAEELNVQDEIKTMFVLDAVIMNTDRHKNNFGFIMDNRTLKLVGAAPLFDHNLALLPYAVEEKEFEYGGEYYRDHGPRIGDDWVNIAVACLTPRTRKVLINMRGFEFTRHAKFNLPEWRLKALEHEMQDIIQAILDKDALYTKQIAVRSNIF